MKSIVLSSVLMILFSNAFSQHWSGDDGLNSTISRNGLVSLKQLRVQDGGPGGGGSTNFDAAGIHMQNFGANLFLGWGGGMVQANNFNGALIIGERKISTNTYSSNLGVFAGTNKKLYLGADKQNHMIFHPNGQIVVGTGITSMPSGYRLFVEDGILTEKLKVAVKNTSDWSDYVFADEYKLMPLEQVEKFVNENKHLPNVPSAVEVVESGIDVAKMDAKLLEKIEELTLYIIQQQKEINELKTLIK